MQASDAFKREPIRKPPAGASSLTAALLARRDAEAENDPLAAARKDLLSEVPIQPPAAGIQQDVSVPLPPGLPATGLPGLQLRLHLTTAANHPDVLAQGLNPALKKKGIGGPNGEGSDAQNFYALDLQDRATAGQVDQDLSGGRPVGVVSGDEGIQDTNYRGLGGARRYPGIAPPIRDRVRYPGHGTFSFPVPLTPRSTRQLTVHANEAPILQGHRMSTNQVEQRVHDRIRAGLSDALGRQILP